ncbi:MULTISPECIES: HIT family protein [Anaerostipes]|uniref:HIT family protein n=1 Tax=Anaerostipes TaxID=207244 RepID=UPI000950FBE1|nr:MULTISPECIES: HIT family protein [Anaerostipes]MCI5622192.1 HIT family protein [Anaerostipes sp.]MDY2726910.1 HIT family protein [Anaerostipes faecalis]OLR59456.1 histidine triad (HIT) protein [Anaerostipes sp. 494a]
MKEDCIFCKIANGDIPSNTIYENSDFKVIMDIAPATKGHVLIIPKEHFKDIYEIDAETAGRLFQLATVVARALKEVLNCDGMNVLQNNGEIAGQTVFHFHMHLIPRYEGDTVTVKWEEHPMEDVDMEQLRQDIRKAL